MLHFAVLLGPNADLAKSFTVRADAHETRGDALVFVRDGGVVHQVPRAWVATVEPYEDARAASDAVAAHRESRVGGATIHVQESAAAAPRGRRRGGSPTAVPAEGIAIRIEER